MLRYPQLQSTAVEAVQLVSFSWDPSEPRQHMSPHGHVGHLWQLGRHIRFWDPGRRERPQHRFCQSRRLPKQCGLQPGGFQQPRFQYLRAGDLRSDKLREVCRKHRARRLQCRGPHARHCLCRRAHVPFDVRNRSGDYGLGFGSLSLRKPDAKGSLSRQTYYDCCHCSCCSCCGLRYLWHRQFKLVHRMGFGTVPVHVDRELVPSLPNPSSTV